MIILGLGFLFTYVSHWTWAHRTRRDRAWWAVAAILPLVILAGLAALHDDLDNQKLLAVLALPTGLVWCMLGVASVWALAAKNLRSGAGYLVCFVVYSIAGNGFLGSVLLLELEREYPPVDMGGEGPVFDAVFVMGGATSRFGDSRAQLGGAGDRVLLAAQLQRMGRATTIVASGFEASTASDLAGETAEIWLSLGVPSSAIVQLSWTRTSREELTAYTELTRAHGWTRVGLITSAWHLRRAMRLAAANGLDIQALPADHRGRNIIYTPAQLVPHAGGFSAVHVAAWEFLGAAMGR